MDRRIRQYFVLASILALATFILIVMGATVRVNDAGVSCPDWPMCYGQLIPFPGPEGGFLSPTGQVYPAWQVFLEWSHRLVASLVGILALASFALAVRARAHNPRLWKISVVSLLLLALQIKLGGVTVLMDNISWTVTLHLGNAMLFYGSVLVGMMAASRPAHSKAPGVHVLLKLLFPVFALIVFCTLLLGATVSTSHAGPACGGLPDCFGMWWPVGDPFKMVNMEHRLAAILTFITALTLFAASYKAAPDMARTGRMAFIAVLIQACLGITLLYSFIYYVDFYKALSVTHLAWATVVWTVALTGVVKTLWGPKDKSMRLPLHP